MLAIVDLLRGLYFQGLQTEFIFFLTFSLQRFCSRIDKINSSQLEPLPAAFFIIHNVVDSDRFREQTPVQHLARARSSGRKHIASPNEVRPFLGRPRYEILARSPGLVEKESSMSRKFTY